jgi:hypothetical protein
MENNKNIWLLPTNEPSRLYFNNNDKNLQFCKVDKKSTPLKINQNIYITSDEDITSNCWTFNVATNTLYKTYGGKGFNEKDEKNDWRKIILTTDPKLIADGVQPIPDEFLEWFVKNSSCEFVEVMKEYKDGYGNWYNYQDDFKFTGLSIRYKIIIPQEEPKQGTMSEAIKQVINNQLKQETLEESACKALGYDYNKWILIHSKDNSTIIYNEVTNWCKGVKWQKEQDKKLYSEEEFELIEYIQWIIRKIDKGDTPEETVRLLLFEREKIEQFKKK